MELGADGRHYPKVRQRELILDAIPDERFSDSVGPGVPHFPLCCSAHNNVRSQSVKEKTQWPVPKLPLGSGMQPIEHTHIHTHSFIYSLTEHVLYARPCAAENSSLQVTRAVSCIQEAHSLVGKQIYNENDENTRQ